MRIINEKIKCACCGKISDQEIMLSYSSFGAPDLDYKKSGMASRAFIYGLQICPECNYIANDISDKVAENLVAHEKDYYKEAIKNEIDLNVKKFFLMALINEDNEEFNKAADNYIFAFWLTENYDEKLANKFLLRAINVRKKIFDKLNAFEFVQTIDLLRRNKEFDLVISNSNTALLEKKLPLDPNQIKILNYEIKISKLNDSDRHNFFEVAMDDEE